MALTKVIGQGLGSLGAGAAADAKIVFDGNAQDYHIGLDDSADTLVIGKGSALGTTTAMSFDANGIITKPLQPAFHVNQGSAQNNLSPNSNTTITFANENFDNNSDFSSNTFTAPVTGKYQINATVRMDNLDIDTAYVIVNIVTSNRTVQLIQGTSGFDADQVYQNISGSHVMDMDANDTAILSINLPGSGASQADISDQTRFSGYLVC